MKVTALVVAILGIIASLVLGGGILLGVVGVTKAHKPIYGVGILGGGLVLSWVVGLALYGFGELIEKTKDNNYMLSRIASHTKDMLEDRDVAKK